MLLYSNDSQHIKRGILRDKKNAAKVICKKYKTLILKNDGDESKRDIDKKQ